jgi:hypothetical protein
VRVVRLLAAAALWLLGVAGVAGVGCFAVDSIGHEMGVPEAAPDVHLPGGAGRASSSSSSLPTRQVAPGPTATVAARPWGTAAEVAGSAGPSSTRSSAQTSTVLSARSEARSAARSAARSSGPPAPAPPTSSPPVPGRPVPAPSPAVTAPPSPSPSPSPGSGTYTTEAGTLTVSCAGSAPALVSVDAAPGWRASADQDGDVLEVRFLRDSGQVLDVGATCRDGMPVFTRR